MELLSAVFRGKKSNWGKLRGKGVLQELRIQLFTVKQDDIKEKARENTMFSLAFLVRWLQFGYFASTVSGIKSHIFINDFGVLFS